MPGIGQSACFGATLTTAFNPITVAFVADASSGSHSVCSGDYTYQFLNPGLTVSMPGQVMRVGDSIGSFNPVLPPTARLTLAFNGQLNARGLAVGWGDCGIRSRPSTVIVNGPDTRVNLDVGVVVGGPINSSNKRDSVLAVSDGARFSTALSGGGNYVNGAVTISGTGSRWDNLGQLSMGGIAAQPAQMTISAGGYGHVGYIAIIGGDENGPARVTVADADSLLDVLAGIWIGNGPLPGPGTGTGVLHVGSGGSVRVDTDISVGRGGAGGTLLIDGGGRAQSGFGFIGLFPGAPGMVTVTDAGSRWDNLTGGITVASQSDGHLNVLAGAQLTVEQATNIGDSAGVTGEVVVSGAGSTFTAAGYDMNIGNLGSGTLRVSQGGIVSGPGTGWIARAAGSTGLCEVTGAGSRLTRGDFLFVGFDGRGALSIADGGVVESSFGLVGVEPMSAGVVSVSGAGSAWRNVNFGLTVGTRSSGTLLATAGGHVSSRGGVVGDSDGAAGSVTLDEGSWTSEGDFRIAGSSGARGVVNIAGTHGGLLATGGLLVGDGGADGTLSISGGGSAQSAWASIGQNAGTTGVVTIDGVGSRWNLADIRVGACGHGELRLTNGASLVSSFYEEMANCEGSVGELWLDGASSAAFASSFRMSYGGQAALNIVHGSTLFCGGFSTVGESRQGGATVLIDGAGSAWTGMDDHFITNGTETVRNGAVLRMPVVSLFNDPAARLQGDGLIRISGVDSGGYAGFYNLGSVAPGPGGALSTGSLTIEGDYTQYDADPTGGYAAGVLEIELAGSGGGGVDRLVVTGVATLGGQLALSRLDGFSPGVGQTFPILTAASVAGRFDEVTGQTGLGAGRVLRVEYGPTTVTLVVDRATGLVIQPGSLRLPAGFPVRVAAFAQVAGGLIDVTTEAVWSTDDGAVALIAAPGLVRAATPGHTVVRVAFEGFAAFVPIDVTPLSPRIATDRVSLSSAGAQGDGSSGDGGPFVSSDGRFVVFDSSASNLVAGDTNSSWDVFVRDLTSGTTTRVSVDSQGGQGNWHSQLPGVSGNGRVVAFASVASNLVSGDTNGHWDIFAHDTQMGVTERVSVATNGGEADNDSLSAPVVSDNGRYVAFASTASNLVFGDTNGREDVFIRDRQTGVTSRVSVGTDGSEANSSSFYPAMSADGRYVVFTSFATNLVAGPSNNRSNVFVRDTVAGRTELVSARADGGIPDSSSQCWTRCISADGRFVVFQSYASNLDPAHTNLGRDIYLRDRTAGTTTLVSRNSAGVAGNNDAGSGSISANGRLVFWRSYSSNLVPGDTNQASDAFVRDLDTGMTRRVSESYFRGEADGNSDSVVNSGDGAVVVWRSSATNLAPLDTNAAGDVFVRWRCEPDINGDRGVDVGDFLGFLALYAIGDTRADINGDGGVDVQDFLSFLAAYAAGC